MVLRHIPRLLHIFSLDVALSSVAMSVFAIRLHRLPIPVLPVVSLGLFVWAIYLLDHAGDAQRLAHLGPRRQDHFNHRTAFLWLGRLALLAAALSGISFFQQLDSTAWLYLGLTLSLLGLYLWIGQGKAPARVRGIKEFILAPTYVLGIGFPLLLCSPSTLPSLPFFIGSSLIAMQGILGLAILDRAEDAFENNSTAVQQQSRKALGWFMAISLLWLGYSGFQRMAAPGVLAFGLGQWAIQLLAVFRPSASLWRSRTQIEWSFSLPAFSIYLYDLFGWG